MTSQSDYRRHIQLRDAVIKQKQQIDYCHSEKNQLDKEVAILKTTMVVTFMTVGLILAHSYAKLAVLRQSHIRGLTMLERKYQYLEAPNLCAKTIKHNDGSKTCLLKTQ